MNVINEETDARVCSNASVEENNSESTASAAKNLKEGIDGAGASNASNAKTTAEVKISFRDKVVGSSTPKPMEAFKSLSREKLGIVTGKQGDKSSPRITFFAEGKDVLATPYEGSIVIKLLGKHISYTALVHRLKGLWKLKGGYHILDVGFGYFMVKCDLKEDREKILLGGPWKLNGYYLAVKPWTQEFKPCEKSFGTTLVWIRITGMNILFYQEHAMELIASAVGCPIKVDLATKDAQKGRFARACVQIDLSLPAVMEVIIDDYPFQVEYEDLDFLCSHCKCFGHNYHECKNGNIGTEPASENVSIEKTQQKQEADGTKGESSEQEYLKEKEQIHDNKATTTQTNTQAHDISNGSNNEGGEGVWIEVTRNKGKKKMSGEDLRTNTHPSKVNTNKASKGITLSKNHAKSKLAQKTQSSIMLAHANSVGNMIFGGKTPARKRIRPASLNNSPSDSGNSDQQRAIKEDNPQRDSNVVDTNPTTVSS